MINRTFFFQYVRQHLFGGSLKQPQVQGLTAILDEWDANYKNRDDRWLAYMLATVHHETDRKFQGIEEYGPASYFEKYNNRQSLGNGPHPDGVRYKGRGFVQLTGRQLYRIRKTSRHRSGRTSRTSARPRELHQNNVRRDDQRQIHR